MLKHNATLLLWSTKDLFQNRYLNNSMVVLHNLQACVNVLLQMMSRLFKVVCFVYFVRVHVSKKLVVKPIKIKFFLSELSKLVTLMMQHEKKTKI